MGASREVVAGPNVPAPIGPYSPGVRVGDLLFVSGQAGIDPDTGEPGETFGSTSSTPSSSLSIPRRG